MNKVKWGVLGTAYIFERDTARGMELAQNCEMVAIAGRSMEKAQAFKEKYHFRRAYGSYEELLDDPEIEAIYIALPNTLHYEWTIKALQHGKHVLCEKPLAPTEREAKEMFQAARDNNVLLMEAFAYQHTPYLKEIRKLIEDDVIGDIVYAEAALITSDYDLSNIRMRKETFGGCTYDLGVYSLSLLQRMTGMAPEKIHVAAVFSEEGIDTYTTGILEYPDGKKTHFDCGMVLATEKNAFLDHFAIHGTKGSVTSVNFSFNAHGKLSYRLCTFDGVDEVHEVEVRNNYCLEVEQFGRCVRNEETPYLTEEFSVSLAGTVDKVLDIIGYWK